MVKIACLLFTIILVTYKCNAYKILVIFPLHGKSHNILGNGVVRHLLDAGHEVTFVTSITNKNPHPKLHQVEVTDNCEQLPGCRERKEYFKETFNLENIISGNVNPSNYIMKRFWFQTRVAESLANDNVQKFLSDKNENFDVVIAEWMYNELYSGLAALYNAPLVWVSTIQPHGQVLSLIDEYLNPAYNGFFVDSIPPFSFADRASELWQTVKYTLVKETVIRIMQWWEYKKLIAPHIAARGRVPPAFRELIYNASLILGNSHISMGRATSLPEAYKPIGGYHITDKVDPLPEDLKRIMDDAKDGIIYFSMGSNLRSRTFPEKIKNDLLRVFESLKQTIFWKFEEDLPNTPKNVRILKWAPQQSILAHPNCILFITHGGLLSTTEAIHAGVPIIGIPIFADQFVNVNRAVNNGFAKKVTLSYIIGDELKAAIEDILRDPVYTQKMKEQSFIYHDRPAKPGAELVHWVEHVIKTNGAAHLRSAALLVPWYQKAYLDLILLLTFLFYVLIKVSKLVLPIIYSNNGVKQKKN